MRSGGHTIVWVVASGGVVLACLLAAMLLEAPAPGPAIAYRPAADATAREPALQVRRESTNAAAPVQVERTELPLRLLGTVVRKDVSESWAAIESTEDQRHFIAAIGGTVLEEATVVAIEAERILLEVDGHRQELVLAGRTPAKRLAQLPGGGGPADRSPSREGDDPRVHHVEGNLYSLQRQVLAEIIAKPGAILDSTEVRVLPRHEQGRLMGVQVNSILPGSLWARAGVENGDLLTDINGTPLANLEAVLDTIDTSEEVELTLAGRDGTRRNLRYRFH